VAGGKDRFWQFCICLRCTRRQQRGSATYVCLNNCGDLDFTRALLQKPREKRRGGRCPAFLPSIVMISVPSRGAAHDLPVIDRAEFRTPLFEVLPVWNSSMRSELGEIPAPSSQIDTLPAIEVGPRHVRRHAHGPMRLPASLAKVLRTAAFYRPYTTTVPSSDLLQARVSIPASSAEGLKSARTFPRSQPPRSIGPLFRSAMDFVNRAQVEHG